MARWDDALSNPVSATAEDDHGDPFRSPGGARLLFTADDGSRFRRRQVPYKGISDHHVSAAPGQTLIIRETITKRVRILAEFIETPTVRRHNFLPQSLIGRLPLRFGQVRRAVKMATSSYSAISRGPKQRYFQVLLSTAGSARWTEPAAQAESDDSTQPPGNSQQA